MFAVLVSALVGAAGACWPGAWPGLLLLVGAGRGGGGGLLSPAGLRGLCGWGVPAQRAVLMLALLTLLRLAGLRWPWPMQLLATMVARLLDYGRCCGRGSGSASSPSACRWRRLLAGQGQAVACAPGGWTCAHPAHRQRGMAPLTLLCFASYRSVRTAGQSGGEALGQRRRHAAGDAGSSLGAVVAAGGLVRATMTRLPAVAGRELPWAAVERPDLPALLALAALAGGVLLVLLPWRSRAAGGCCWPQPL